MVKPFIKKTHFKKKERDLQKEKFEDYIVNQIHYAPPEHEEPQKYALKLNLKNKTANSPSKILYTLRGEYGVEKRGLKVGKSNIFSTAHKGILIFKPFGYDIYNPLSKSVDYSAYDNIFVDKLDAAKVELNMSYLPDLNVNILMEMIDTESNPMIRGEIFARCIENMENLENEKCVLYPYESHGDKVLKLFEESEKHNWCFACDSIRTAMSRIEQNTIEDAKPDLSFIDELRILLKDDFTVERRTINLSFYAANFDVFRLAFDALQNLGKADTLGGMDWSEGVESDSIKQNLSQLREVVLNNPVKLNQFKRITFHYSEFDKSWLKHQIKNNRYSKNDYFLKNTYILLYEFILKDSKGKKSIRLRNFEFNKL